MPQQQRARAAAAAAAEEDPLVLELSDITAVRRCADPSLPEGEALWLGLASRPMVGAVLCVVMEGICFAYVQTQWTKSA